MHDGSDTPDRMRHQPGSAEPAYNVVDLHFFNSMRQPGLVQPSRKGIKQHIYNGFQAVADRSKQIDKLIKTIDSSAKISQLQW